MRTYYNENDPKTAAWLRELIRRKLISPGVVDDRSITEVHASDLKGFTRCHFFAGIGGWDYALNLAGFPEKENVWSGSCPCQPFSVAGRRRREKDARHLWPDWFRLIKQCRPKRIFGEQVASRDGLAWLDVVSTDLENRGYAVGAINMAACSVGAPHLRQRTWFVADSVSARRAERWTGAGGRPTSRVRGASFLDDPVPGRYEPTDEKIHPRRDRFELSGELGDADRPGGPVNGFWAGAEWTPCRDGTHRAIEPGTFPLAYGVPARVVRLRGYGNAIVPQVAKEFVKAYMEAANGF